MRQHLLLLRQIPDQARSPRAGRRAASWCSCTRSPIRRAGRGASSHLNTALQRPRLLWPRSECGEAPDDDGDDGPALFTGLVLTAVSPDRRLLLLGDGAEGHYNGGDIGLWDVARGRWRARLLSGLDYHGEDYCGIFSPDSRRVFAAPVENMEEGSVIAWSTAEGRELWCRRVGSPEGCEGEPPPEQRESVRLAVSGDGRVLAAMSLLRNKVLLLDVETGAVQAEVDIRERRVCGGVALDARGEHLALGQRCGGVLLLSLAGRVLWEGPADVGAWSSWTKRAATLRWRASMDEPPQGSESMTLDGAVDGVAFVAFVQKFLALQLHAGDIVVMDNLSVHKVPGVREAIEAAGATLTYLPTYSPDLNPIERWWDAWASSGSENCRCAAYGSAGGLVLER